MKVVGLTGGIGSGKTTVAKMFEALGVSVYYADDEAKTLMNTSSKIKSNLQNEFGEKVYLNGELNRAYLANIVFKDKEKLQVLNSIVHPEVNRHFKNWVSKQKGEFVIQENAILFENNKQNEFDFIITVTAPVEVKVERVMKRDSATKEQVIARMNNQFDDSEKIKNSDYVIENMNLDDSLIQVKEIYQALSI